MTLPEAPFEQPMRWRDEPRAEGDSSRPEQRVARLIRRVAPMTLSEGARVRLRRRVLAVSARRRPSWRAGAVRRAAIGLVVFASGAVLAAMGIKRTWRFGEALPPTAQTPPAAASARRALTREQLPSSSWPAAPPPAARIESVAEPVVAPVRLAPRARVTAQRASAVAHRVALETTPAISAASPLVSEPPARAAVAPPSSPLSTEADLLKGALVRLRRERDGEGALADLDAYSARFPNGLLRPEADATRAEALLSLGRDQEALRTLDRLVLRPRGREAELRVIRGELRAARDCAGAIADFDETLAAAVPDGLAERALYGRASCLGRSGDRDGARRDLDEYARRFPSGRFSSQVRRARGL